ncbi:MAG: hypothetical protein ACX939_14875, partial [Hyphococcus sp.]
MLKSRELIVGNAKSDARDVWTDYEDAFVRRRMLDAFEDYLSALEVLRIEVGRVQIWNEGVKTTALASIDRLQALVKAVAEGHQSRRLARDFTEMRARASLAGKAGLSEAA